QRKTGRGSLRPLVRARRPHFCSGQHKALVRLRQVSEGAGDSYLHRPSRLGPSLYEFWNRSAISLVAAAWSDTSSWTSKARSFRWPLSARSSSHSQNTVSRPSSTNGGTTQEWFNGP